MQPTRVALLFAALISLLVPPASAQEDDKPTLVARSSKAKITKRGSINAMKGRRIVVNGKSVTIGELATRAFADQVQLTGEFRKGRKALLADPVVSDEAIETDDELVLTSSTEIVVMNPTELERASPEFKKSRNKERDHKGALKDLKGESRKAFKAWKAELKKKPKDTRCAPPQKRAMKS